MLRNVIVHIANEQPFMADLVNDPSPSDVCLICRNMRTMNGKKPVYVDFADSTFLLPIAQIRFIEIPATSYEEAATADEPTIGEVPLPRLRASAPRRAGGRPAPARGKRAKTASSPSAAAVPPAPAPAPRRVGRGTQADDVGPADRSEETADTIVLLGSAYHDTELDGDLLRRIREA